MILHWPPYLCLSLSALFITLWEAAEWALLRFFCCTRFDAGCLFRGEEEKKRIPDQLCRHNMHEDICSGVCTSNEKTGVDGLKVTAPLQASMSSDCIKSCSANINIKNIKQLMAFKILKSSAAVGGCILIACH